MGLEELKPDDTPDEMTPAWLGCISWALGTPEVVEQFRKDTGLRCRPARSVLDRMVDEATGADRQFLEAFIKWVNVNVWGPVDGPK